MVYICVDRDENKDLWAARIIDESWKAKHYFLSSEKETQELQKLSDKDISSLCSGGASYSFIKPNGEVLKDIQGPFYLGKEEKENLFK